MVFFCGCSAAGSASPCQGEGREFESRHPLQFLFGKRRLSVGRGGVRAREAYSQRSGEYGLRVKMCVWLGVSRGLDLAFLNAD